MVPPQAGGGGPRKNTPDTPKLTNIFGWTPQIFFFGEIVGNNKEKYGENAKNAGKYGKMRPQFIPPHVAKMFPHHAIWYNFHGNVP